MGIDYLMVYITEAHPTDGWQNAWAPEQFASTAHARSDGERLAAARTFVASLGLSATPIVVDSIADELENRYEARPERLYVVHGGKVLWRGGLGPFEYDAPGLAAFLEEHTAAA
tara:strand:+ start:340 stop:681 length:342 start_codon:yes stop_codon:yes gene_type:complete